MTMDSFFKCSVKRTETADNGMERKVTDEYIVDAMSYTEAEARIMEEIAGTGIDSADVDITRLRVDEVVPSEGGSWFKVTVDFISLDERTGDEKRKPHSYMVEAGSLVEAISRFEEHMEGTVTDWALTLVKEEKRIVDYIKVNPGSDGEKGAQEAS